ncbi:hypothetical protein [Nocardioides sp. SYSU DS0663]|uniref:hypothetical protein n=1 Tax=Nocardioides sp. SYSU DS0663 TaxID=3416445 RepID=UPI003F4C5B42
MTGQPMRADDPMSRSGARWCPEHDRWECAAKKPDHHASAVRGMAMCRHHVGKELDLARTQGEANLLAWSSEAASRSSAAALDPGQVVMDQLRVAVLRADIYGELLRIQVAGEDVDGLVGATYAVGREGTRVETGERVRGLAALEAEWRDRVVRFAKAAHDMGIAERVVELEQQRAELVTGAFLAAIDALGLVPGERSRAIEVFLDRLGGSTVAGEVVA